MSRNRRVACFILIAWLAVGQTMAQSRSPLDPADPFSIKQGSTFSASGGSTVVNRSETPGKISQISSSIREAQDIINRNYISTRKTTAAEFTKSAVVGMLHVLDPHSNFYDSAEWKDLLDEQRSGYTGIGVTIANFETAGVTDTFVLSTFPGSPAARAQLRFGDKIVAINGERTTNKSSDLVRDKIRGATGTGFRLTVERSASNRVETIEIRRNRVPQPSIPDAYVLRPGIGYIDLSEGFNYTTSDEFDAAMQELKRSGIRSLILDLRGNGGGIVDQAVKLAEKFLPAGTLILTQRGRSRMDNRVWRSANSLPETMPLVVLVDEETASASEIVAGAFQDDDRAMIVGSKTFGKGLVQSVIDLPASTGLTLTTGRYLTPSGRSIQRDYSKTDRYDYFNHKTAVAEIDKPYFEARTITDRPVFGGDGILPDEAVKADEITEIQAALLDPIFFFSRELVNQRITGHENYRMPGLSFGKRVASGDFAISESLLASFAEFAAKNSSPRLSQTVAAEKDFIRLRLRYNITMASLGAVSANQVLTEQDPQVARAVEALPRAAQLSASANLTRKRK